MDLQSAESQPMSPQDGAPEPRSSGAPDEIQRQQAALFAQLHAYRAAAAHGAPPGELARVLDGIADKVRSIFAGQDRLLRSLSAARWEQQGRIQRRVLDELARAGAVLQVRHPADPEEAMHLIDPLLVYLVAEDPFTQW